MLMGKKKAFDEIYAIIIMWGVFYGVFGTMLGFIQKLGHPLWEIMLVGFPIFIIVVKWFLGEWD